MITIKQFMESVNYRISEGSEYLWQCYGDNAYRIESWDGDQDSASASIVFDTNCHTVYEIEAHDFKNQRAYRWINPDFLQAYRNEAVARKVNPTQAWDDVEFIDLEVEEDILEKLQAMIHGEVYDTRVQVPITLPDDELFILMKMAHERDLTLNEMVESMLETYIRENPINKPSKRKKAKKCGL